MTEIFNRSDKTKSRQRLRNNASEPEKRIWYYIRNQQLGIRFRRQVSIGNYIVDFYCPIQALVVEIDGDSHFSDNARTYDRDRTAYFKKLGLRVLRFTNLEVMQNIEGVILKIKSETD